MPEISLLVADKALRAALLEQLVALPDFKLYDVTTPSDAWASSAKIIIAEQGASELAQLQTANPKTLFVVGDAPAFSGLPGVEVFTKPFYLGALLDRIMFHHHVMPRLRSAIVSFGIYRLEPQNRQIIVDGSDDVIRLTEKETALLEYLAQSDKHVPRDELLSAVWGYDERIDTHTLETHMYHLRRKLNPDGTRGDVVCNDGHGYFLKFV